MSNNKKHGGEVAEWLDLGERIPGSTGKVISAQGHGVSREVHMLLNNEKPQRTFNYMNGSIGDMKVPGFVNDDRNTPRKKIQLIIALLSSQKISGLTELQRILTRAYLLKRLALTFDEKGHRIKEPPKFSLQEISPEGQYHDYFYISSAPTERSFPFRKVASYGTITKDQILGKGDAIRIGLNGYRTFAYFQEEIPNLQIEWLGSVFGFLLRKLNIIDGVGESRGHLFIYPEDTIMRTDTQLAYEVRRNNGIATYFTATGLNTHFGADFDIQRILDLSVSSEIEIRILKDELLYAKGEFERIVFEKGVDVSLDAAESAGTDLKGGSKIPYKGKIFVRADWSRMTDNPYLQTIADKELVDFSEVQKVRINLAAEKLRGERDTYARSRNSIQNEVSMMRTHQMKLLSKLNGYKSIFENMFKFLSTDAALMKKPEVQNFLYAYNNTDDMTLLVTPILDCLAVITSWSFAKKIKYTNKKLADLKEFLGVFHDLINGYATAESTISKQLPELQTKYFTISEKISDFKNGMIDLGDGYLSNEGILYVCESQCLEGLKGLKSPLDEGYDQSVEYSETEIYDGRVYTGNPRVLFKSLIIDWDAFLTSLPRHQISFGEKDLYLYTEVATALLEKGHVYRDSVSAGVIYMYGKQWMNVHSTPARQTLAESLHRGDSAVNQALNKAIEDDIVDSEVESIDIFDLDRGRMQRLYDRIALSKMTQRYLLVRQ